jgi:hypothetical protein
MTPLLRLLEQWLPPPLARGALIALYAGMLVAVVLLAGYGHIKPVIYLDVH